MASAACTRTVYMPVETTTTATEMHTDTLRIYTASHDSIYVRDSVYVDVEASTIYRERTAYRYLTRVDTVYHTRVDTVYRDRMQTITIPAEKKSSRSPFIILAAIIACALAVDYAIRNNRRQ